MTVGDSPAIRADGTKPRGARRVGTFDGNNRFGSQQSRRRGGFCPQVSMTSGYPQDGRTNSADVGGR